MDFPEKYYFLVRAQPDAHHIRTSNGGYRKELSSPVRVIKEKCNGMDFRSGVTRGTDVNPWYFHSEQKFPKIKIAKESPHRRGRGG